MVIKDIERDDVDFTTARTTRIPSSLAGGSEDRPKHCIAHEQFKGDHDDISKNLFKINTFHIDIFKIRFVKEMQLYVD